MNKFTFFTVFMLLTLLAPLPSLAVEGAAPPTGRIEGRTVLDGKPVPGVAVFAAKDPEGIFAGALKGAVSDKDGLFALELPKGKYYLAASKSAGANVLRAGELYSFYGGNPVTVDPARPVKAVLNLVVKPQEAAEKPSGDDKCGVEGIATLNGEPLDGVRVYVYLDPNGEFKGMGYYMAPPTGVDGAFRMRMNEGRYYLIARKRASGEPYGPLTEGDYFGYPDINPVVARKGVMRSIEIPMVKKAERPSEGEARTVVSGTVKHADGTPARGMHVCLYTSDKMTDRPAVVSRPTGADGAFSVELPAGGKYYIGARDVIGGPVEPGQLWGRYNGSPDHSVVVETGKAVGGLEVMVDKVVEE